MRSLSAGANSVQAYPAFPTLRYYGFTARNMTNVSSSIIIRHGVSVAGVIITTINLAAKESTNDWPEPGGIPTPDGIFIDRVAGQNTEIAVYYRT